MESSQIISEDDEHNKSSKTCCDKVYPSESPRGNLESPLPSFSGEGVAVHSPLTSDDNFSNHPSVASVDYSPYRSGGDEGEYSMSSFESVPIEYFHDSTDFDLSIVSSSDVFFSLLTGLSSSDATSRHHLHTGGDVQSYTSLNSGSFSQEQIFKGKPEENIWGTEGTSGESELQQEIEKLPKAFDFETNGPIWFPPSPVDFNDEMESNMFAYDDDNDEVGNSDDAYLPAIDVDTSFSAKDFDCKEPLKTLVLGHFRALLSQLLLVQRMPCEDWLEVITAIAFQAAKYIKPDTSKGGSMDPCDYLKIKCIASGTPDESKVVKGIVCTKNIKHKRMISHYKNARLLILGGALEYEKAPDGLASVQTLLQQENDHLSIVVSKIEAHRPNVLLVEKTVSSYALDQLFAKEISVVLNVKRPLLERIAKCTTATIIPSTDHISMAKLGHCELFHLEKVVEDHEPPNQFNKKPSKNLMFFEGCLRRVCCTIVLKGASREELKKVKLLLPYAVFAAYHLSLETSFLADEGAFIPDMDLISSNLTSETLSMNMKPFAVDYETTTGFKGLSSMDSQTGDLLLELGLEDSLSELGSNSVDYFLVPDELGYRDELYRESGSRDDIKPGNPGFPSGPTKEPVSQGEVQIEEVEVSSPVKVDDAATLDEHFFANEKNQSIVVSFSSHSMVNGAACQRTRLLRVKFYGPSDKPLGRYLTEDLFDQSHLCKSCHEPAEAHVTCYTHQNANLTIKVRHLPTVKLSGKQEGKIWMWHRCLRCELVEGVPPATQKVVMSDVAWGLSFGKFLELSFYNHVTGNRVASCGHSLQRDCLRFFGFGSMIASFQYSNIDILSVHLPPLILEFNHPIEQNWIRKEANELFEEAEAFYVEISSVLETLTIKSLSSSDGFSDASELQSRFTELNDLLVKEKNHYKDLQQLANKEIRQMDQVTSDIIEINRLRDFLLSSCDLWDDRISSLEALIQGNSNCDAPNDDHYKLTDSGKFSEDFGSDLNCRDIFISEYEGQLTEGASYSPVDHLKDAERMSKNGGNTVNATSLVRHQSDASLLADRIDSAWSGHFQDLIPEIEPVTSSIEHMEQVCKNGESAANDTSSSSLARYESDASLVPDRVDSSWSGCLDDPAMSGTSRQTRRTIATMSTYSLDSGRRAQESARKRVHPSSLRSTTLRGFHSAIDIRSLTRDSSEAGTLGRSPSASSVHDASNTVHDDEPMSIVSYALSSKEYEDWVFSSSSSSMTEGISHSRVLEKLNSLVPDLSPWRSFSSTNGNDMSIPSFTTEDQNGSPHLQISFEDESCKASGKVKYSVTCYFGREFNSLRKKCCPSETDFVRSISRCRKWCAQGGKSNVYFAKSLDERFIVKQVTKTELESFEEFGPNYFKYLTEALTLQTPTCLAKFLGMYQVTVKHMKGGKDVKKMDLMVMENLFFKRSISKVYDLKGSKRSRYISDATGSGKVLLDMNLLETVDKNPIFVGCKAKRNLERAVWNDTSFLASVDVMDYSLLVGVDEERKELVMGIIDFMRQYTWDKHLETWVKASGILGGPKNASPTIISPKEYKKRFRKAMTSYFLTVPDQWT